MRKFFVIILKTENLYFLKVHKQIYLSIFLRVELFYEYNSIEITISKIMKEVIVVWKRSNWHEYNSHQQRFSITFCSAVYWFSFYHCVNANVICSKGTRNL